MKFLTGEVQNQLYFFSSNGLVNYADKAAVLYNRKGKNEVITVECLTLVNQTFSLLLQPLAVIVFTSK